MPWTPEELTALGGADELRIAGRRAGGGLRRPVVIWAVTVDDGVYVRSVRGAEGGWYRGVLEERAGRIDSGGVERDVVFADVAAEDPLQSRIDAAYAAKYPGSRSSVDAITTAEARATTLRTDPA